MGLAARWLGQGAGRTARAALRAALGMAPGAEMLPAAGAAALTGFDRLIDASNRVPRPAFAFGTLAIFVFAMIAPDAFARRMQALAVVPEPMWWLLGGVVGFHFGAREAHYMRGRGAAAPPSGDDPADAGLAPGAASPAPADR